MPKLRVYEIARSMQQKNSSIKATDLVDYLRANGFDVKSTQSSIENDAIVFLLKALETGELTEILSNGHAESQGNIKLDIRKPTKKIKLKKPIQSSGESPPMEKANEDEDDDADITPVLMQLNFNSVESLADYSEARFMRNDLESILEDLKTMDERGVINYRDIDFTSDDIPSTKALIKVIKQAMQEYKDKVQREFHETNKDLLRKNFDYCLRKWNVSESELEDLFGHGGGYYSRAFNPNDPKRRLSVDGLKELCETFNISMDRFISEDLEKSISPALEKTKNFIDTLINEIDEEGMRWHQDKTIYDKWKEYAQVEKSVFYEVLSDIDSYDHEVWKRQTNRGTAFLIVLIKNGAVLDFKFVDATVILKRSSMNKIFDTRDDGTGNLRRKCMQLLELLRERENIFSLSKTAEDVIDGFFD